MLPHLMPLSQTVSLRLPEGNLPAKRSPAQRSSEERRGHGIQTHGLHDGINARKALDEGGGSPRRKDEREWGAGRRNERMYRKHMVRRRILLRKTTKFTRIAFFITPRRSLSSYNSVKKDLYGHNVIYSA